ncbi:aspartate aminotransferase family protein|uniref:alanine--glyoxylate transaminase n=1 Tax=Dendrosporobacter quercicolus TaxID=146817 RepID=A0A1G9S5Z4_9FIRM|nr:aspartate aminotransferase family protein [Dendrosporobacter quercicolus]NSL49458.1 aspartate aminotransferase family protein [Dendrosporobacter quercicolus DSM 1736]SDM30720.1 4-aminobutyrate aminotransferase / (S)-3-amino-2-methylpropionate transaminase [Dendrosporobacter quercicolus]
MASYIGPAEILNKKRKYLIPCVYHFYQQPMQLVRGQMQYLYDQTGKQYLDCFAGVSVVNCGHCNPQITKAICEQVNTLQHTTTIYLTETIVNLAERLAGLTPGRLQKSFFCASGTEANEGAALLASIYTGKHEFISMRQGLHGRTKLTMNLTGLSFWRTDTNPMGGISFAPNAYCYRCPMHKRYPECDLACANEIETVIQTATSGQVAALIAEPIQGNGGIITPPPGYFKRMKEILDKYNILLIIDEVQTGFGRTGKMFAIEHYEVEPDIMTMAKALANGTPVGAFTARPEIADKYTRPGASTLGGNPVTAAAALATLDVITGQNLPARAAELGQHLKNGLLRLQEKHPFIGDVRGLGLMLGAELVLADQTPAIKEIDIVLEKMKDRGFLVGKNGPNRNVLAFQPPLVITQANLDDLLNHLDDVLSSL